MTSEQKRNAAIIATIAIAAYFLLRPVETQLPLVLPQENPIPEQTLTDEWVPGQQIAQNVWGGPPFYVFGGDTTINIPDSMLGSLSRQYIPMFGFTGVTAIGAQ